MNNVLAKGETMDALDFIQAIPKGVRVTNDQFKVLSGEKWYMVASVNKRAKTFSVETGVGYEKKPLHYSEIVEIKRLP